MNQTERTQRAGEEALRAIQKKHPDYLSGPRASRENYDPGNPGKVGRYLFFQRGAKEDRAQFIPVLPLREGIIEIRVYKTTLLLLGAERDGLEREQLLETREEVRKAVKAVLDRRWRDKSELLDSQTQPDIAIAVDFDESNLGLREFKRAVTECAEAALSVLLAGQS